jgi:3',5'-cyclic AMP phosphodiesterase CpdA
MNDSRGPRGGSEEPARAQPDRGDPELRVAHLSDPHLFAPWALRPWYVFDKRLLGGINALVRRRKIHRREITEAALEAVADLAPDHVVVSGDVSTVGAEVELRAFRQGLARVGLDPRDVTVLPGNHDAYLRSIARVDAFGRVFAEHLRSDPPFAGERWPRVRLRRGLAVVACNSARPSAPLLAVGTLGAAQLERLEQVLTHPALADRFRLVVLHHPPQPRAARWHNRLTDALALRQVVARAGAELLIHGHLHRPLRAELPGPSAPVSVRGVSSVSSAEHPPGRRGAFALYRLQGRRLVGEQLYRLEPAGDTFVVVPSDSNPVVSR